MSSSWKRFTLLAVNYTKTFSYVGLSVQQFRFVVDLSIVKKSYEFWSSFLCKCWCYGSLLLMTFLGRCFFAAGTPDRKKEKEIKFVKKGIWFFLQKSATFVQKFYFLSKNHDCSEYKADVERNKISEI
jgi:hypothetical protein